MKTKVKAVLTAAVIMAGMFTSVFSANANPLHDAASKGDIEEIKTLCEKHPEWINEQDDGNNGGTFPIFCAKDFEVVKCLLEHGADVNVRFRYEGVTFLHVTQDAEQTAYLVEHGADINAKDNQGRTPLHTSNNFGKIKYLVEHGAEINAKDNRGHTPFYTIMTHYMYTANLTDEEVLEIIKYLVERGADISEMGLTDLQYAVLTGDLERVKYLVEQGADINAKNKSGCTSLHLVRDVEIAKYLVEHGADINAKDVSGRTPLKLALDNYEYCSKKYDNLSCERLSSIIEYLRSQGAQE